MPVIGVVKFVQGVVKLASGATLNSGDSLTTEDPIASGQGRVIFRESSNDGVRLGAITTSDRGSGTFRPRAGALIDRDGFFEIFDGRTFRVLGDQTTLEFNPEFFPLQLEYQGFWLEYRYQSENGPVQLVRKKLPHHGQTVFFQKSFLFDAQYPDPKLATDIKIKYRDLLEPDFNDMANLEGVIFIDATALEKKLKDGFADFLKEIELARGVAKEYMLEELGPTAKVIHNSDEWLNDNISL